MQTPTQTYQDRRDSERAALLVPSAISTFGADGGGGGDASATPDESRHATRSGRKWHDVPWRTIVATIVLVVASIMLIRVVYIASDMIMLLLVAGFFAIVLNRPVRALQRRFTIARGLAIGVVVGATVTIVLGLITVFVLPVRTQLVAVLTDLPGTAEQASRGTGPIGNLTSKLHLVSLARDHQASITKAAESIENSLPSMLSSLLGALLKSVTVIVLVCLMLTQSATLSSAVVQVVPVRYRTRVTDTAEDAAASVSGYMIGNLLISMFAGLAALVVLLVLGVPNAIVISLFVAFADLLPLIGATIGAVVAVIATFTVSTTAGIIALVFFVLYQQFENSVLQVMVMSRRAHANPLVVLLSVLLGVELFGIIGALLAIPVAGALSVILSSVWRHRPLRDDELLLVIDERPHDQSHVEAPSTDRTGVLRWVSQRFSRHKDAARQ